MDTETDKTMLSAVLEKCHISLSSPSAELITRRKTSALDNISEVYIWCCKNHDPGSIV